MSQYEKEESSDRYSLRGKVFHQLREDILSGHYKEHEELREMAISEEMDVSRTPVREALRQLELEGLVSIIPNKGAYVTGITRKDVEDIYAIRSLLEGLCARWATAHITEKQLDALEENIYLSEFHASKGHAQKLTELDDQFHDILYEACSSKMLNMCGECASRTFPAVKEGWKPYLSTSRSWRRSARRMPTAHRSWQPCICAMLMII